MKDDNDKVKPEEKLNLLADLDGINCELDHSGDPEGTRPAVNYMMLQCVSGAMIALPICKYCQHELAKGQESEDFDWYLLVCTKCNTTKWLYKSSCKHAYPEQVHFIRSCPECDMMFSDVATETIQ